MAAPRRDLPRRALLRGTLASAAIRMAQAITGARAQQSACKCVDGEVSASGWCKLFDMVD